MRYNVTRRNKKSHGERTVTVVGIWIASMKTVLNVDRNVCAASLAPLGPPVHHLSFSVIQKAIGGPFNHLQ